MIFVSYNFSGKIGNGSGNIAIERDGIFQMADIWDVSEEVKKTIKEGGLDTEGMNIAILNWRKFDEP